MAPGTFKMLILRLEDIAMELGDKMESREAEVQQGIVEMFVGSLSKLQIWEDLSLYSPKAVKAMYHDLERRGIQKLDANTLTIIMS